MKSFIPTLNEGETYAGIVIVDGSASHHLVVLPDELVDAPWKKAVDWAKERGADLPTRRELALCRAAIQETFSPEFYWSAERHGAESPYAWCQHFNRDGQGTCAMASGRRARAVRRVPI